jgi:SulP family sulfate permease
MAAIISAGLIGLTLLFLTPLFYYLPNTILASIIMVAVFGLIDTDYPRYLWKTRREDFYMLAASFFVTLFVGIQEGIGVGVALSLLVMIYRSTRPHAAVLGRLPDTGEYRNVSRFAKLEVRPEVLVLRYDSQLYFANTAHFVDTVRQAVAAKGPELRLLVLDASSISYIDATALQALQELLGDLRRQGVDLYLAEAIGPVRDFLRRTEFIELAGPDHFFLDVQSAIDFFDRHALPHAEEAFAQAVQSGVLGKVR